jgi:orotidine-5'-phosphate decarboxylase
VDPARIPEPLRGRPDWIYEYNLGLIEATAEFACAYKPNLAFYEALGPEGMDALARTVRAVPDGIPVIGDAKRGDIGHTATAYARALFEALRFDAVTVNPYLGFDTVEPFLRYEDRGVFLLCKTSNPGSGDLQDLLCETPDGQMPLYQVVARRAATRGAGLGLVVGATYPEELASVRAIAPEIPFLIPGVGAQAGDLERTVLMGTDARGELAVINSSRGIAQASLGADWQDAARRAASDLRDAINRIRRTKKNM